MASMLALVGLVPQLNKEGKVISMSKLLKEGTKIRMKRTVGVILASTVTDNFEAGSIGEIIGEHNGYHEATDTTWYNVKFEKGTEILPEVWFEVIEEPKEECDCDKCKKCCDDVELPESHGVELTIKYDGDNLIIGNDNVDLRDLSDNETSILYNTVDTLYRLLGVDLDD